MILRSLRVEGFGPFRDPVVLDDLGPGVHVLHGPNETGKSSLVMALARALFDRYRTRGEDMERHRPWGTRLSPRIEVELEAGGTRYKLEKAFLDAAESGLFEWKDGRYQLLDREEDADRRLVEIFSASTRGRGASTLDNWGLARLLWLTQDPRKHDLPALDGDLRERLLAALGGQVLGEREQALVERIQARWSDYFTRTGREAKRSPLQEARPAEEAAAEKESELEARRQVAETQGSAVEDARGRLVELDAEREELARERAAVEEQAARESEHEKALAVEEARLRALKGQVESLQKERDRLAGFRSSIEEHRARAAEVEPLVRAAEEEQERAAAEEERRAQAAGQARETEEAAQEEWSRRRRLEQVVRTRDRWRGLGEALARVEELAGRIEERRRQHGATPVPSAGDLRRAEGLEREIVKAEAKLEQLGIEVRFEAEDRPRDVTWEVGGEAVRKQAVPAEELRFQAVDRGTLRVAGVGRLEVRTGARDAATERDRLEKRRGELAQLTGRFSVGGVEELRELRRSAEVREQRLESDRERLADLLPEGFEDLDGLRAARDQAAGELAEARSLAELASGDEDELEAPDTDEADAKARAARELSGRAEQAHGAARAAREETEARLRYVVGELEQAAQAASVLEEQLADRRQDGRSEEVVAAELSRHLGDLALAEAKVEELRRRIPPEEARAARRRERLEAALEKVRRQRGEVEQAGAGAEALIRQARAEGLHSRLNRAAEEHERARSNRLAEEERAAAADLLRDLATRRAEEVRRSVVGPVEGEVRRTLEHLRGAGAPGWELRLDPELQGAELCVDERDAGSFEDLSWGAREQLMLALRLSFARLLSGGEDGEPWLVVLDDPLVNTDGRRRARALELIQRAGRENQVLVLTAFPGDYRTLEATEWDLVALQRGGRP